ncbi:MAG: hypothetical protein ACLT3O_02910 [Blautia massiliensis (ex Durand et al. 2017)]|uniref:hypothetical protein n=1 Tax=Blautia massiliensis (ex Durand et al. 2017) TaxID=1737424 RepID=UPI0039936ADC
MKALNILKENALTFVDADDVLVPYFFQKRNIICEKKICRFSLIGGNTLLDNEEFNEEKQKQIL